MIRASAVLLGATAVALGAFTAPAMSAAEEEHCTVLVSEREPTVTCFATFTEAVRVATGGSITDAPASVAEALRDEALMRRMGLTAGKAESLPALTLYPVGIEFAAKNYVETPSTSLTYYDGSPCTGTTADVDKEVKDMPWLWDDRVSSFVNGNNCWTNHYQLALFRGKSTGYLNDRTIMPTVTGTDMDNRTRSIRFS
jgi:hypothetical protein